MCKKSKGSILAYSLIVLAMMFAIVGSISAVSVLEKKSAGSSQASMQAFQIADNGVQFAIKKINSLISGTDANKSIANAFSGTGFSCVDVDGVAKVEGNIDSDSNKPYILTFYPVGSTTSISSCSESVINVDSIKSIGSFKNTSRAVNVAVAAAAGISSQDFTGAAAYYPVSNTPLCAGGQGAAASTFAASSAQQFCEIKGYTFGIIKDANTTIITCAMYKNGSWTSDNGYIAKTVRCIK